MYKNLQKCKKKLAKYRPKCRRAVKTVEKSLKTAKNAEKAKKGSKLTKYRRKFRKRKNIPTKKMEKP